MYTITGKYASALITLDGIEPGAIDQVKRLLDCEAFKGQQIAIMPDAHAGVGCVIGFTSTIDLRDPKVIPNVIGVDIGCGVVSVDIGETLPESLKEINGKILRNVPMGFEINDRNYYLSGAAYEKLCTKIGADYDRVARSVGSLGGGNHFIEIGQSTENGHYWLTVHTGSRNLGLQVCKYHQEKAIKRMTGLPQCPIDDLKQKYSGAELGAKIAEYKAAATKQNPDLCYLEGLDAQEYLEDMMLAQMYADLNRETIWKRIELHCHFKVQRVVESVHNYIHLAEGVVRKGAIRAHKGETMIIPFNMRDGLLLCKGNSNSQWNCSAPHGAGRVMSRAEAKRSVTLGDYEKAMSGVYSTCVNFNTIDESPMAYKPADVITAAIGETCTVIDTIRPVLNIKAGEGSTRRKP